MSPCSVPPPLESFLPRESVGASCECLADCRARARVLEAAEVAPTATASGWHSSKSDGSRETPMATDQTPLQPTRALRGKGAVVADVRSEGESFLCQRGLDDGISLVVDSVLFCSVCMSRWRALSQGLGHPPDLPWLPNYHVAHTGLLVHVRHFLRLPHCRHRRLLPRAAASAQAIVPLTCLATRLKPDVLRCAAAPFATQRRRKPCLPLLMVSPIWGVDMQPM
jgi:hypothetical protein